MAVVTTTVVFLTDELRTVIDTADAELVAGFNWRPLDGAKSNTIYVHAWHKKLHVYMHRLIIGAGPKDAVDHVNGNGLDNRRANLRIATPSQNHANRRKDTARNRAEFTSRFKGVYWDKGRSKWVAMIHDGKSRSLGRYETEVEAAEAYDTAALAAWGAFARLNLPALGPTVGRPVHETVEHPQEQAGRRPHGPFGAGERRFARGDDEREQHQDRGDEQ